MKYLFIILFIILFFVESKASDYEQILKNGINKAYNFEFSDAEKIFKSLIEIDKENPKSYLALSNIYVWQFLSDNDNKYLKSFEYYSDLTQKKAKVLQEKQDNADGRYCYATIQGYKTLIFLISKNYTKGIWSAKECLINTNELKKTNKEFFDIYLWSGLFNFAFSQTPSSLKPLLKLAGIDADFMIGIEELGIASKKSIYNKVEAEYFLSQIFSIYIDNEYQAFNILNNLHNKYPDNVLISYSLASQLIKDRKPKEAEFILQKIVSDKSHYYQKLISLCNFLLGDIAFFMGEYSKAKSYYEKYLRDKTDNEYVTIALFRKSFCHLMLNESVDSKKDFQTAANSESFNEEGDYYKFKSEIYSQREMTQNEKRTLLIENTLKIGDNNNAEKRILEFAKTYSDDESRLKINYFLGYLYFNKQEYKLSLEYFNLSQKGISEIESWIVPFSKYYLGKINVLLGNNTIGINYLQEINKIKGFYFENTLKLKIRFIINSLT